MKNGSGSYFRRNREALNTRTAKIGGFSAVLTVIVLAILIAVNLLVNALPTTWTHYDISAARLYSLTSATKSVVNNLDRDVTIYWVVQSDEEDDVVERLLNVYSALSDKISVVKKNPDIYPTFAQQYTDDVVSNNSIIVEAGDKNRYISYDEIYETDTSSYYTTGSVSYSFDGEGQITAAIDYVTSDILPQIYVLSGHGETDLSESFTTALERANIETQELSLLNIDEIPEDAACILIHAPETDISEEEADMLRDYIAADGSVFVLSGLKEEDDLVNLQSLLEDYSITVSDGVVIEGDRNGYAFRTPYLVIPSLGTSDITDSLIENDSNVIVPIAQGLNITYESLATATIHSLISTSDQAFSKIAGYDLETYEKEDGDIDGPFSLGVAIESTTSEGKLVWFSTDYLLDDTYNSYSSGANIDLAMNSVSWMVGESDAISIRSKSLDYNYLTISEQQASVIKIILIGALPLVCLLYGIDEVVRRKKSK